MSRLCDGIENYRNLNFSLFHDIIERFYLSEYFYIFKNTAFLMVVVTKSKIKKGSVKPL